MPIWSGYDALLFFTILSLPPHVAYLSGFMGWKIAREVHYSQSHQNVNRWKHIYVSLPRSSNQPVALKDSTESSWVSCGPSYLVLPALCREAGTSSLLFCSMRK